jgi:hypothetical protein
MKPIELKREKEIRMKKAILAAGMAVALFVACPGEKSPGPAGESSAPEQKPVGAVAETIAESLEGARAHISKNEIVPGLNLLLDVTLLTRPEGELPAGFKERIESARKAFGNQDFAAGGQQVAEALNLWCSDSGLPMKAAPPSPEEGGQIAPLAELFLAGLEEAEAQFKQGLADEGVSTILKTVLLLRGPQRP